MDTFTVEVVKGCMPEPAELMSRELDFAEPIVAGLGELDDSEGSIEELEQIFAELN